MNRTIARVATAVSAATLFLACNSETDPPRGGLILTISNDGSLELDRLKVQVFAGDQVLLQNEYSVPETVLPNTLSVVSNGSATATATIVVSGWRSGVPVDRRDAIVTQIPSDRVAGLDLVLSARCTPLVRAGADPTVAESLCAPGQTCDPTVGKCATAVIDASGLPEYRPGEGPRIIPADPGPIAGPGGGAPSGCTTDADCAAALLTTTPEGCAVATCNLATRKCAYRAKDQDGDGVLPKSCSAPGLTIETGLDCDDADKSVHPGAWDGPIDSSDPKRTDSCEGKDNDCNGVIDDGKTAAGLPCTCAPGATRECAATADGTPITYPTGNPLPGSTCHRGTQTCGGDAQWGACVGAVGPVTRDCGSADDNDCNGKADNITDGVCMCPPGNSQSCFPYAAPARAGAGPCRAGTQTCQASGGTSSWSACSGATGPLGADTCSPGNDNNCNGTANEGCPCIIGSTKSCAGSQCGTGTQTCVASGASSTWGSCQNISGPSQACSTPGLCGSGTKTCNSGVWSGCVGPINPYCPGGYSDVGNCVRSATASRDMSDGAGGDGVYFGRVSIPFTQRGTVTSSINFSYVGGGCYSSSSPDAISLSCPGLNRSVTQCEASSPPGNGCTGASFGSGSSTYCDLSKIKGWTPAFQGTCSRRATMSFTDTVAKGCY